MKKSDAKEVTNLNKGRLQIEGDRFELDGKPFQILSGELHYPRIPRVYWRDRLKKAKALGLNTITTYVFWNLHEPTPGHYEFADNNDIAAFVREAQEEGLFVILRPGPYVCAEWEFGGYPSWLLKDRESVIRSSSPGHMTAVGRWLRELGRHLAPLQLDLGGPIIMVQVENEYFSVHKDLNYVSGLRDLLLESGFTEAMMLMVNPLEQLKDGSLPGILQAVNFGIGKAELAFNNLAEAQSEGPRMVGEYWTGWYDSWGLPHHRGSAEEMLAELRWMLSKGYSFSLYMLHGGTTFGWMNGGSPNPEKGFYSPYVNSYDYDAPLGENGNLTKKYFAMRELIATATGQSPPEPPAELPTISIPEIRPSGSLSLWEALPKPVSSKRPLPMEDLGQAYGYVLYRTVLVSSLASSLAGGQSGDLVLHGLHDYARVFLDGVPVGTMQRRLQQDRLQLSMRGPQATLDILVENSGRMNYTDQIRNERKGITDRVEFAGRELLDWEIFSLPMSDVADFAYGAPTATGPSFYQATFSISEPGDTFLDTCQLGKGMLFVNGRPLGRFWSQAGPTGTLFLPSSWLRKGENRLQIFDFNGRPDWSIQGLKEPVLDLPANFSAE